MTFLEFLGYIFPPLGVVAGFYGANSGQWWIIVVAVAVLIVWFIARGVEIERKYRTRTEEIDKITDPRIPGRDGEDRIGTN